MVGRAGRARFVGRQDELAMLQDRMDAAGRGAGSVVLVAGEPGMGKTRLLTELAERARASGWLVLTGRAYDTEGMPPYLPFVEALREHVRACPDDVLRAELGRGAADIALLVPELRERLTDLQPSPTISPEQERYRLFESVTDFVLAIARGAGGRGTGDEAGTTASGASPGPRPLLLVLDDLHWADKPSLLLLLHLARRLHGAPLLLAGAYRTTDLDRTHPLAEMLAGLRRERLAERLPLAAMSAEEAGVLIAQLCRTPVASSVVEAIYRETGGNAFFIEEVARHLQAEGRDLGDARATVRDWGIPEGVREVVGRRLARLSDATNQVLRVAAVLGDGFTFDLLREAGGQDAGALEDALDEALSSGILREDGARYSFGHALIRQTVYDEVRLPRRQRIHLQVATALETVYGRNLDPHLSGLAAHLRLAGAAADPNKVFDYSRRAGEAACAVAAWEEAATHWQAAIELMDEQGSVQDRVAEEERCALLLSLAEVQQRAGDVTQARATFERTARLAERLGLPEHLALAALGYGEDRNLPDSATSAQRTVLEQALGALGEADSPLRARVLSLLAEVLAWLGQRERAIVLSREALAIARRVDDGPTLTRVLNGRLWALRGPGDDDERLALAAEMVHLAETAGDRELAVKGHRWRIVDLFEKGDIPAVDREIAVAAGQTEQMRQPMYTWWVLAWKVARALLDGDPAAVERSIQAADEVGRIVNFPAELIIRRLPIYLFHRDQARFTEIGSVVHGFVNQFSHHVWPRAMLALLACDQGRESLAREEMERLSDSTADLISERAWSVASVPLVVPLAEVCAVLGDARLAAPLYDRLLPYAGRCLLFTQHLCYGAASRYLGLLAMAMSRWDVAEAHFVDALAMHERMQARPLLAHARREYAAMLLRRGRRADLPHARTLLEEAIAGYTELDMDYWAGRAQALLSDPLVTAGRPPAPAYPDGLSVREVEVLRLVAAGRTNKEIGETLVISINTVLRHVAHIFEKTGAANRAEAATYAARHGITR
jgi:DNA-binding NarL/FixJ family response regulator/tetratricopeptide (TPR) repeat protein